MSYMRDERYDATLPSIRSSPFRPRSPTLQTIDDGFDHRHDRYTQSRERESLFYHRPTSPSGAPCRKQVLDMQEQLRIYREELAKKDRLITDLTTMETPRASRVHVTTTSTSAIEDLYSNDRIAAQAATKSELAALQVRCESLSAQVREMQSQLDVREDKIRELKLQLETSRESEAKYKALHHSMKEKLVSYESEYGSYEEVANRSGIAIETLQKQNSEAKHRIIELERRIRELREEKEQSDHLKATAETRFTELLVQVNTALGIDGGLSCGQDSILNRVNDVLQENAMLRGKMTTMKEYMSSAEVENKASRETIMRLVSETEREQRNSSKYSLDMENLRLERDQAVTRLRDMEHEVSVLRDRLDANQRAWDATRSELEERESRFSRVDLKLREYELQARNHESSLQAFKESIASILQVDVYEETIRERINALMMSTRDKSAHIDLLESKVSQLTEQLERQIEMQRTAEQRMRKYHDEHGDIVERLRKMEAELAAGDVLRDGMRADKERYLRFLEKVSQAMKMDPITADMGLDMAADAILVRADQLCKLEADTLVDRKTHIYNLQRKIKSLKEQMESKDLHMELLRKKIVNLEERLSGSSNVEREKDEEYVKNKKLVKLVEKYKMEINEQRLEIRDLKARLLESSDMRTRTLQQEKEIENLEAKVGQLEGVRQKQSHRLNQLSEEIEVTNSKLTEKRDVAHNTVHSLSSELRTTKAALQEVTQRERQLLDLRQVIARMLGLDVNTLAVPDYEILSRLEKLILANQSNAATVVALDTAMEGVSDSFLAGYQDATNALHMATRSRSPTKRMNVRTRSVSPSRRKDTRSY